MNFQHVTNNSKSRSPVPLGRILRSLALTALFLAAAAIYAAAPAVYASVSLIEFGVEDDSSGGDAAVRVYWETAFEQNFVGFHIWRGLTDQRADSTQITQFLIPGENSPVGSEYEHFDPDVSYGVTYYYWLELLDSDGNATVSEYEGPEVILLGTGGGLSTPTPQPTTPAGPTQTPVPTSTPAGTVAVTATSAATDAATATSISATRAATATSAAAETVPTATLAAPATSSAIDVTLPATAAPINPGSPAGPAPGSEAYPATNDEIGGETTAEDGSDENETAVAAVDLPDVASVEDAIGAVDATTLVGEGSIAGQGGAADTVAANASRSPIPTAAIMLLVAGAVFLIGGAVTAVILLQKPVDSAGDETV